MRRTTKIWLVAAVALIVIGLIMFAAVMSAYQWDFAKLGTAKYETNTYEITGIFSDLSVDVDTADIIFALSDDGKCRVECYEEEKVKHTVIVQEDTLIIQMIDERSWYDYLGISFRSPKVTVYLPDREYGKLFIKASTGEICIENVSADTLDLSVSTGHVTVSNVNCADDVRIRVSTGKTNITDLRCKNVISDGDTGDVFLDNVVAAEGFLIERDTGDVKFEACDAKEISVETDTGDVTGSLLTDKVFIVETDTGSIDVPRTASGGKCEITTDTGDIELRIKK